MPKPIVPVDSDHQILRKSTGYAWWTESWSDKTNDKGDIEIYFLVFDFATLTIKCDCLGAKVWSKFASLTAQDGCQHQRAVRDFLTGKRSLGTDSMD